MTEGHKHRHITVTEGSLVHRFLLPVLHLPLRKVDFETANNSRLVWGAHDMDSDEWTLTVLGLLHTFTGLTIIVETPPERCEECGMRHLADLRHDWTDGT